MPSDELSPLATVDRIDHLERASLEVEGRMPWSSNATFLVTTELDGVRHRAIYKPVRGERPLWDFEPGLHRRERAAFLLSEALRLHVVPPTIIREGPLGTGSLQWFVDADHREHYFTIHEQRPDLHDRLRGIAALDFVANNTDRKSGHCLLTTEDVWAIDNGLCFSEEFKLRTVIWDFAGDPIDPELISRLRALAERLPVDIAALLSEAECAAVGDRARELAELGSLPYDETGRRYPWPLV